MHIHKPWPYRCRSILKKDGNSFRVMVLVPLWPRKKLVLRICDELTDRYVMIPPEWVITRVFGECTTFSEIVTMLRASGKLQE